MRDRTGEVWEDKGVGSKVVYLILSPPTAHAGGVSCCHEGLVLCSDDRDYVEGTIERHLIEQGPWEEERLLKRLA